MPRTLVLPCLVILSASPTYAGAVVELTATDMGELIDQQFDPNDGSRGNFNPIDVQHVTPGQQFLVHLWLTADMAVDARGLQVDYRGPETTVPFDWLGHDINNLNPDGLDGVPNFWFDYTNLGPGIANTRVGTFPARGLWDSFHIGANITKSTGEYLDYSNLIGGDPAGPQPPSTIFQPIPPNANMFAIEIGEMTRIGAMVVAVPESASPGEYTLDLLNASAATIGNGMYIDFGFVCPDCWWAYWSSLEGTDPANLIAYADGAGPLTFTVIPEPAVGLLMLIGALCLALGRAGRRRMHNPKPM